MGQHICTEDKESIDGFLSDMATIDVYIVFALVALSAMAAIGATFVIFVLRRHEQRPVFV